MKSLTKKLLQECKKIGITKVAICVKDKSVPASRSFAYNPHGWVFAFQTRGVSNKYDGVPIHDAIEALGLEFGIGGIDSHQINAEAVEKLDHAAYIYKSKKWAKV